MKEITYYNLKEWDYYKNDKKALMDLAEHGFFIDEILALKDPQLTLQIVYYGHGSKYYKTLKDSEFEPVRYFIGCAGLFEKNDFEDIIIHCQEGVSRSHAVALFIAKYFMKNDKIYKSLLHQEGKVYGGNAYVYDKLIQYLDK